METASAGQANATFCVLGPISLLVDGLAHTIGGARQRRLLGLLLASAGQMMAIDVLTEHLWDDDERPQDPAKAIRTYVSRLRQALDRAGLDGAALIVTAPPGYRLALGGATIDAEHFDHLGRRARQALAEGDPRLAANELAEAFRLWRGEPYAEFAGQPWAEAESQRLLELHRVATHLRCEVRIELGEHEEVIGELDRMVADDELATRPAELLMLALFRADRQADALRVAVRHRRALRDVGLDVPPSIAELDARIAASDDALRSTSARQRPQEPEPRGSSSIPPFAGALVGRDLVIEQLRAMIEANRVVTITGIGGMGKTRVAAALASVMASQFADGVSFCDLTGVADPASVHQVVADGVGARHRQGRSLLASIGDYLASREMLVVLDNCEDVIDAAAEVIEATTPAASSVTFLATSRQPIGLQLEATLPLEPLDHDSHLSPAVALFEQRSKLADPSATRTEADVAAIHRICARLDGIPLAIELAAARSRASTPQEIEERLDDALAAFQGPRRAIDRHRTMEAAIDASYVSLNSKEQTLLHRLSVFRGGATRRAIREVCGTSDPTSDEIDDLVERLVDTSFLVVDRTASGGSRLRLLEPLRQFALARFTDPADRDATRARHLDVFTRWTEAWNAGVWGDGTDLLAQLVEEVGNVRAAVEWAIENGDVDRALRIVDAARPEGFVWDRHESGDWGRRALELANAGDHPLAPPVAAYVGLTSWWRGDLQTYSDYLDRSESMAAYDPTTCSPTVDRAVYTSLILGDADEANRLLDRVRPADIRDRSRLTFARTQMMSSPSHQERAAGDVERLRVDADASGSSVVQSMAAGSESVLLLTRGEFSPALERARYAVDLALAIDARYLVHYYLFGLGLAAAATGGGSPEDLALMRDGLREQRDAGNESDQWLILVGAAAALLDASIAQRVQQGLRSSFFGNSRIAGMLPIFFADVEFTDGGTENLDVDRLVVAVADAIDDVLASTG